MFLGVSQLHICGWKGCMTCPENLIRQWVSVNLLNNVSLSDEFLTYLSTTHMDAVEERWSLTIESLSNLNVAYLSL